MSDFSLIKIDGELSKPATILIEKVSYAIGGIFKPIQIERIAKAEAKAQLIEANTKIEISELEQRALLRMVREEGKKQENIENITAKALPYLTEDAKPENIEDDWLANFFDKSRLTSDEQMQEIWAKILAGEAKKSSTFSKRTIELVSTLDKSDAELFTNLCSFIWPLANQPLIYDVEADIYNRLNINFQTITHLHDIGLVNFNLISGYIIQGLKKHLINTYGNVNIAIEMPNDENNTLQIGNAILTQAGQQLLSIVSAKPSEEFKQYVITKWTEFGYKPQIINIDSIK